MYVLDQSGYVVYSNHARAQHAFLGTVEPCALKLLQTAGTTRGFGNNFFRSINLEYSYVIRLSYDIFRI